MVQEASLASADPLLAHMGLPGIPLAFPLIFKLGLALHSRHWAANLREARQCACRTDMGWYAAAWIIKRHCS